MIWGARSDGLLGLVDTMQRGWDGVGRLRIPTLYAIGDHDQIIPRRPAVGAARRLPPGARTADYPDGYHLLLRDNQRLVVARDVLAFLRDPAAPLPSGVPPIPGTGAPGIAAGLAGARPPG
jgi:pimeloyl-ACP methyl ester carboxylesterase